MTEVWPDLQYLHLPLVVNVGKWSILSCITSCGGLGATGV